MKIRIITMKCTTYWFAHRKCWLWEAVFLWTGEKGYSIRGSHSLFPAPVSQLATAEFSRSNVVVEVWSVEDARKYAIKLAVLNAYYKAMSWPGESGRIKNDLLWTTPLDISYVRWYASNLHLLPHADSNSSIQHFEVMITVFVQSPPYRPLWYKKNRENRYVGG